MATRSSSGSVLVGAREASKEVRARFEEQAESFRRATTILRPDEVAGEYDPGRMLRTTLGGELRALTQADLQQFKRTAEALGKKFTGGITAKSVIDLSLPIDRERSNRQIRVAIPTQRRGNDVHFVTNAGPDSQVTRHHVHVQFLNLDAAVASPSKASEMAKLVTNGRLRFQCDCEHHLYRYSYIATIGKWSAGRPQTGYPKITNPRLVGVACKHVLRVMQQLSSPLVRQYVERMIQAGRKDAAPKLVATTKRDREAMAALQAKQANFLRNSVESSLEKRTRLAQQRKIREISERNRQAVPTDPAKLAVARRQFENSVRKLVQMGGISHQQAEDMLKKMRG